MKHKQNQHTLKCYSPTIKYHNWKNDQWNTKSSGRYKEEKWKMNNENSGMRTAFWNVYKYLHTNC